MPRRSKGDPWRIEEWLKLPNVCAIAGCDAPSGVDQRGPMWLRDGTMHKLCTDHWEAVFRILGEQVTWEHDAQRSGWDRGYAWHNRQWVPSTCPANTDGDGRHNWRFDGDDPYVICTLCNVMCDALTGDVISGRE